MALKQMNYESASFDAPTYKGGRLSPEEIVEKMAETNFEHRHAIDQLKQLEIKHATLKATITTVVHALRPDLLLNEEARELMIEAMEDPKFKVTVDFTNAVVFLEQREVMGKYQHYEMVAKRAEKQYDQLVSMLIWEQSKNKRDYQELMSLPAGVSGP